jgi:hypothetical protein
MILYCLFKLKVIIYEPVKESIGSNGLTFRGGRHRRRPEFEK